MSDTVTIISEDASTKRRKQKTLTTENSYYLRMIQELANKKLKRLRDLEHLHVKDETKERNKNVKNKVMKRERQPSTGDQAASGSKKKKITKKSDCGPVVVNEVTERLKEYIVNEMKGMDVNLVIQKRLFASDTRKGLNRLNMPINQLEKGEFLTADEKRILCNKKEIEVRLLGPTLEMYKDPMNLRMWKMETSENYVLATNWYRFRSMNKMYLKRNSIVQVWSFRVADHKLCFAIVCVEEPDVEVEDSDS